MADHDDEDLDDLLDRRGPDGDLPVTPLETLIVTLVIAVSIVVLLLVPASMEGSECLQNFVADSRSPNHVSIQIGPDTWKLMRDFSLTERLLLCSLVANNKTRFLGFTVVPTLAGIVLLLMYICCLAMVGFLIHLLFRICARILTNLYLLVLRRVFRIY